jgi:hypothetical protein
MPKKGKGKGKGKKKKGKSKAKRGRVSHKSPVPLGTTLGAIDATVNMLTHETSGGPYASGIQPSPLSFIMGGHKAGYRDGPMARAEYALKGIKQNAMNLNNYKGLAVGFVVSAAKKIPVAEIAAKPVDRFIKRLTKGKVGL